MYLFNEGKSVESLSTVLHFAKKLSEFFDKELETINNLEKILQKFITKNGN